MELEVTGTGSAEERGAPDGKPKRLLWVMLREPTAEQGVPFRFRRLLPRIFGFELIVVWEDK